MSEQFPKNHGANPNPPLVLAIDDQPQFTALVQAAARRTQPVCSVLTASSGIAGLHLVTEYAEEARVVVLDVRMPDLDGRWLCSEVRRLAPQAQILPLTADRVGGTLMIRLGALPPLIKPISATALADALSHALTLPAPITSDLELAAFLGEQAPFQIAAAQERASIQVAVLASEHLLIALKAAIPLADAQLVAAATNQQELQPYLAARRVQLIVASADCFPSASSLAVSANIPLLICATTVEAPTIPAGFNVVSSIANPDLLNTAICTVATGGVFREGVAQHPLLADLSSREQYVLDLIREGRALSTLATTLSLSSNRVRHILSALYKHFGVSSFAELQAWLQQNA